MDAERLMKEIDEGKRQLAFMMRKLDDMRQSCSHEFVEEKAYRICTKCKQMESLHY